MTFLTLGMPPMTWLATISGEFTVRRSMMAPRAVRMASRSERSRDTPGSTRLKRFLSSPMLLL